MRNFRLKEDGIHGSSFRWGRNFLDEWPSIQKKNFIFWTWQWPNKMLKM